HLAQNRFATRTLVYPEERRAAQRGIVEYPTTSKIDVTPLCSLPPTSFSPYFIFVARNSPSSVQVLPSVSNTSPVHRKLSRVISVKIHRIGVPLACVPTCTTSLPLQRPINSSRWPVTGLFQVMRHASMDGSQMRRVVPYILRVRSAGLGRSARL